MRRLAARLHLVPRASTRRAWAVGRAAGQSWWQRMHFRFYAGWPYGYIGSAIGERRRLWWLRIFFAPFLLKALHPFKWSDSYHGKVMPTDQARRLIEVHEPVDRIVPEQVIPFEQARHLIISREQPVVVLDCPCRAARVNPCLPLDVCLIVGEPFASFVLEHHPTRSRQITPDEAIAILEAEAQRGHVHHAFFKDAMLNRFFAICNCCSCCCGAMMAHFQGTPMLISSGYTAQIDPTRCQTCGTCAEVCPFGAVVADALPRVNAALCMGCGVCVRHCPHQALALVRDESKPAPLDRLLQA